MNKSLERVLFAALVIALLVTHMFGFGQGGRPLILGWVPLDLAYRLAWIAVASAAVFWMTGRLWPNRE